MNRPSRPRPPLRQQGKQLSDWLEARFPDTPVVLGVLFAAHAVLALVLRDSATLTAVHAAASIAGGALWILAENKHAVALYVVAYVGSAEVLWRMGAAPIPWESGKYAIVALLGLAAVRLNLLKLRLLPVLYFLLLLPAVLLTLDYAGADMLLARRNISFNLSGPLCLAVSAAVLSQARITPSQLRTALGIFLLPAVSVACFAAFGLASAGDVQFTAGSSNEASGGFGPNQVSSLLGAGTLVTFLLIALGGLRRHVALILGVVMLALATQCVLTFSRNGIVLAVAGGMTASLFLLRNPRTRLLLIGVVPPILLVFVALVLPRLESFTGGALSARYEDTSTTGRYNLALMDLELFAEHPLFGVGPGMALARRAEFGIRLPAHTEFTRVLGEHGLLGAAALIVLFGLAFSRFRSARGVKSQAVVSSLLLFAAGYMAANAMRLALPALFFALAFVQVGALAPAAARALARRRNPYGPPPQRLASTPPMPARGYPRST